MDPDAALAEIRNLVDRANSGAVIDTDRLAELFDGLDRWLCGGGFLPRAWTTKRRTR